ncbi:MAG TPA: phosphatase PAP2 family protein [Candidatus Acidoferrales bacterium]|nr:phosphatase PAP2 family protein [Candidatus Acidoferrales bacterium]
MNPHIPRWMFSFLLIFTSLAGFATKSTFAQEYGQSAASESSQNSPADPQASPQTDRDVSILKLPRNILQDEKEIVLFPKQLAKGKHWWPTIGILGGTTALIASDPYTASAFRNTTRLNGFNRNLSEINTAAVIVGVPAAIYGVGLLRKDSYAQNTALLAGEAVVDGFLLDMPFKGISGRKQPINYTGPGPYSDSFFHGSHNPVGSGGFYSMHAFAAASVATVIAQRYRKHRWVPIVAYGLAGAICFSRISRSDHFPSDVFFGGAMGIVIARYAVLPARN